MAEDSGSRKPANSAGGDIGRRSRNSDDHANGFTRTLATVTAPPLTPKRRKASAKSVSAGNNADSAKTNDLPEAQPRHSAPPALPVAAAPTPDGVAEELWRIATGEGSESARVSALRTLADIFGMLRAQPPELPEAMTILLDALSRGLGPDPAGHGGAGQAAAGQAGNARR